MQVERLPAGVRAAPERDRITVTRRGTRYGWSGAALKGGDALFGIGDHDDRSYADAEAEGISWAKEVGVRQLFIESDD